MRQCSLASQENITIIKSEEKIMASTKTKKFEIVINSAEGTLSSKLFEKMASKGDVTSTCITELKGEVFTPTGEAVCTITTGDRIFNRKYIDTVEHGIIHTSSDLFIDGFNDYKEECPTMRIVAVKAKLGTAYKCVPVLDNSAEIIE